MEIEIIKPLVLSPVSREIKAPWLSKHTSKFQLADTFELEVSDELEDGFTEYFIVPKGYVTDLASIPRLFWNIVPPNLSEAQQASVIHDYIYSHLYWYYSKNYADRLLRDLMKKDGASKFVYTLFYTAVRCGGKGGWSKLNQSYPLPHYRVKHPPNCKLMEL
jgi:hypothetical protein